MLQNERRGTLATLAILIPALNEVRTIAEVVGGARVHGRVIVIDNGSTDSTAEAALGAGADVVRLDRPGYDAALNAGFARAEALGLDYALTMDADGQHDPADIPRFVAALEKEGCEVVYGIRVGPKRMAERLLALLTRLIWGIRDPWCGMKAYRMDVYRKRGYFDAVRSIGTELLLFAARSKMSIAGIPISVGTRSGQPRFGNALRANLTLFGAILRVLFAAGSRHGAQEKAGRNRSG